MVWFIYITTVESEKSPSNKHTLNKKTHVRGGSICKPLKNLVGGFNPFEKYARQIGSFPQG